MYFCIFNVHLRIIKTGLAYLKAIIIHQTHYEKSDWSKAFNPFTIACELDMINEVSAADIAFFMSSSTSAWFTKPLEVFSSKTQRFASVSEDELCRIIEEKDSKNTN